MNSSYIVMAASLFCLVGCGVSHPSSGERARTVDEVPGERPAAVPSAHEREGAGQEGGGRQKNGAWERLWRGPGPESASFATADEVERVVVKQNVSVAFDEPEPPPLSEITDRARIAAILSFLNRHRDDWEPVPWTPPSGTVGVAFYDQQSRFAGVIRLGGYGSLQGPLSRDRTGEYYKNLSAEDLEAFIRLLGLDPTDDVVARLLRKAEISRAELQP